MTGKVVHLGGVIKTRSGWRSFHTLCGLDGDCQNRDPSKTTCKACLRSNKWEAAVMQLREASMGG